MFCSCSDPTTARVKPHFICVRLPDPVSIKTALVSIQSVVRPPHALASVCLSHGRCISTPARLCRRQKYDPRERTNGTSCTSAVRRQRQPRQKPLLFCCQAGACDSRGSIPDRRIGLSDWLVAPTCGHSVRLIVCFFEDNILLCTEIDSVLMWDSWDRWRIKEEWIKRDTQILVKDLAHST
jgi:hypothetical protein